VHPVAIVLVVTAALAHAGWNVCAKRIPHGGAALVWLYGTVAIALCVPLALVDVLVSGHEPTTNWLVATALSGLLHLTYFILLQRGYAVGDLSVVYPLARGSGPALAVLAAVVVLGERPGVLDLVGAGIVVVGILVIGGIGSARSVGVLYGLATGALIAAYTLWDAYAVTTLAVPPLVLLVGAVLGESLLLSPVALARRASIAALWREHWRTVIVIAVLTQLAYLLVLLAMRIAPVSMVAPTRELSIVFATLAAWLVLGEPHPGRRLFGAAVVVAGVIAIAG
jgi:drug/metabolite transporter (DMT)-like permease